MIYFVEAVGLDRVRVGHARSVPRQLDAMRPVFPFDLRLLRTIDGGGQEVRELHERFAEHRTHGDWFQLSPLRDFIESVPEDYFQKERERLLEQGTEVLERWLEAHGTTPYRFALDNGIDPSVIRKSILHRRGFSPETAARIEKGTGGEVPASLFVKTKEEKSNA